jgi:hypothetical protein
MAIFAPYFYILAGSGGDMARYSANILAPEGAPKFE